MTLFADFTEGSLFSLGFSGWSIVDTFFASMPAGRLVCEQRLVDMESSIYIKARPGNIG